MHFAQTAVRIGVSSAALAFVAACAGAAATTVSPPEPTAAVPVEQATQAQVVEPTAAPTEEVTEQAATEEATPLQDFATFRDNLLATLTTGPRDYEALADFMGESFEILIWRGNGEQMPPSEAVTALRAAFLPPDAVISYEFDKDLAALLGIDPFEFYNGNATGFIYMNGWGDGSAEALLVFNQKADGAPFWQGILLAWDGFAPLVGTPTP